jgi:hypothetical protein
VSVAGIALDSGRKNDSPAVKAMSRGKMLHETSRKLPQVTQ